MRVVCIFPRGVREAKYTIQSIVLAAQRTQLYRHPLYRNQALQVADRLGCETYQINFCSSISNYKK